MKKSLFTVSVCCILVFTLLPQARPHSVGGVENHNVDIPDAELRKLIKPAGGPITANEMKAVTELAANPAADIGDLTGLEHAINLTKLQLIRPLPRTPEARAARPLLSLEPLRNLTKLKELWLQSFKISDMSPLANVTALKYLQLTYTDITRIPDLSRLTALVHLRLHRNAITDIAGVRGLTNLRQFVPAANPRLSDISPLRQLRNLEILNLSGLPITRASLSAVLPFLSTDIDQQPIGEYPPVHARSGFLGLSRTNISDLSVLDRLPNVFLWTLQLQWMGTRSSGTIFYHLKDLTPLVDLMNKGKVINSQTAIPLWDNYGLDYASLYEDIPDLIAGSRAVNYQTPDPKLEREFPKAAAYRGHPRTRYTIKVRAVNESSGFPERWRSYTPRTMRDGGTNRQFEGVPVTFTVTNPDGTTQTRTPMLTRSDGLARLTITLGDDGESHVVTAVVPAKTNAQGPSHGELSVTFTVTADRTVPPPRSEGLTVTFEDYPEDRPTEEFPLTLQFSEPVIGFEKQDITVETERKRGKGTATLVELTPQTPIPSEGPRPAPIQTYTATIKVPPGAAGTVTLIVHADSAIGTSGKGPAENTASEPIPFGATYTTDRILTRCGLGWAPQSQFQHQRELPKVMIYALEFEYDPARNAGYTCKAIEIRTGDDAIENLAGWKLYLGRLYNPSHIPITIPEAHSQVTDRILRLTPEMLDLETFPCNTAYLYGNSHPVPGVHYVLWTDEDVLVDVAYSCFVWGQNAYRTVNGKNVESPRRVSSAALREIETPRLERYISNNTDNTDVFVFTTYMAIEELTWDRAVLSDWLLPEREDAEVGSPNAPSRMPRKLVTTWGALKK